MRSKIYLFLFHYAEKISAVRCASKSKTIILTLYTFWTIQKEEKFPGYTTNYLSFLKCILKIQSYNIMNEKISLFLSFYGDDPSHCSGYRTKYSEYHETNTIEKFNSNNGYVFDYFDVLNSRKFGFILNDFWTSKMKLRVYEIFETNG